MLPADRLPTLSTPRLTLRWLEDADVPALHQVFGDPEVTRYWSAPAQTDVAEAAALLAEIRRCFEAQTLYQWGIATRETDAVIGTCTLASIDPSNRRAEIGFALARAHWGRGLAREAVARLIAFAFDELGLHRLEADVDPANDASIRLLTKLGFSLEGHLRERWWVAGEVADTLLLGLLAPEWRRDGMTIE